MTLRSTLLAAALLASASTYAQAQTVVVSPEDETVIREYVVQHPSTTTVTLPSDFELKEGAVLPGDVLVGPIDAPKLSTKYDYVVVGGRTVLVEPGTRRIVRIYQ